MCPLELMIRTIAGPSPIFNEEAMQTSFADKDPDKRMRSTSCQVCDSSNYTHISLETAAVPEKSLREVAVLLQDDANHLMRDDTRAALRSLRLVAFKAWKLGGIEDVSIGN